MANRLVPLAACLGLLVTLFLSANQASPSSSASPQAESKAPAFDVAAIKLSDPKAVRNGCYIKGQPGGQTFVGRCIPLRLWITYSYKLIDSQLVGGPDWIDTELYDFEAKADHSLTRAELAPMFQTLLADRFHLRLRTETRTMPALALTVDKSGVKMKSNGGPNEWEIAIMSAPGASPIPKFKGTRCPTNYLSWWIAQRENRPVIDKTALPGFWDFFIEYVPDGMADRKGPNGEPGPIMDGPSLTTALREQLGLKLEPVKGPVEVYVIDHVEKVSEN